MANIRLAKAAGSRRQTKLGGKDSIGRAVACAIETLEARMMLASDLYVDIASPGPTHDGSSWDNAYADLQLALAAATSGDRILVADGTYKPTAGTDRNISFALKNGVSLLGGYAGYGAADPDARDVALYASILSGDIGVTGSKTDNSYHVVTGGSGITSATILDGITITAGNANGSASPQNSGGGIYLNLASPSIANCTFTGNWAYPWGAGMHNEQSSPTLTNCTFSGNSTVYSAGKGGGISNSYSSPTLINCVFSRNSASYGAGVYNFSSAAKLINCSLSGNSAYNGGGVYNYTSSPTLVNCTLSGNSADFGAGMYNYSSRPSLTNCIVWGSGSTSFYADTASVPVITYSDIQGGYAGTGNVNADPMFVRSPWVGPDGVFGTADDDYGDLRLRTGSPLMDVGSNAAIPEGVYTDLAGNARIQNGTVDIGAYEGAAEIPPAKTIYVDRNAAGANTGASWTDAFASFQSAMLAASDGDSIRIADGTYKPTVSTDRAVSFVLRGGVAVYGGYAGFGAANPDARDLILYPTILSGDIGVTGDNTDNSYHVVACLMAGTVVLDGLTITAGNANGNPSDWTSCGGGIYSDASWPNLNNCLISANSARNAGGGMYNTRSAPTLTNCTFSVNVAFETVGPGKEAARGGGMFAENFSVPTLINCTFSGNSATGPGGGMYNNESSPLTLTRCIFNGNSATGSEGNGGGLYSAHSTQTLTDCTFIGNSSTGNLYGGGGIYDASIKSTLVNCTFVGNTSAQTGGGIVNTACPSSTLTNCTFSRNSAGTLGGGLCDIYPSTLTNCIFSGNIADHGGGVYNGSALTTLANCTFSMNLAKFGGSMYNRNASARLTNCIVWCSGSKSIDFDSGTAPVVSYSDIEGGYAGVGNVNVDPMFVRTPWAGPDGTLGTADDDLGDLRVRTGSPIMDIGSNAGVPTGITTDLAGNARIQNGTVDMGAYEGPTAAPAPKIVYVDQTATGGNTGASWTDAFVSLQSAILITTDGDTIRVADGTYKPTPTANRALSFVLRGGVAICGGFAGFGAPNPDARDPVLYATRLSGDIGAAGDTADNSYHVVVAMMSGTPVLDGLTITAGNASGSSPDAISTGGGMYSYASSPRLNNCVLSANLAKSSGAGMYNSYSSPTLTNCTFSGNQAIGDYGYGGGMYNSFSTPALTGCTFSANQATGTYGGGGGGMYNFLSSPSLDSCTFSGNSAAKYTGGGIYNSSSSPTMTSCTITGNSAGTTGGGMYNYASSPALTSCVFSGNSAAYSGGMYNTNSSSPTLVSCTFRGNSAANNGGGIYNDSSLPTLINCIFSGNSAVSGGGIYNSSSSMTLVNCVFSMNAATSGSSIYNSSSSPQLTNCIVWGNGSTSIYNSSSAPVISYSDIEGGYAGIGNISADPVFVRTPWVGPDGIYPTADDDYGDLRLRAGSPLLDVGSNAAIPGGVSTDMAGNARIQNGTVDIGAYEGPTAGPAPKIIYVDQTATGGNTGTSWSNAFTSPQSALLVAADGDTIRIADGTYKPTTTTDRTLGFVLRNAVAIYGSYAGVGAANPDARDGVLYPTVLSGDIGVTPTRGDNSYHVIIGTFGIVSTTILDGLKITAGNANGSSTSGYDCGGGAYLVSASPTVTNCIFAGNVASYDGGGVYNKSSSPTLTNCVFVANSAAHGGGMKSVSSSLPQLTNCTFVTNSASEYGGGMYSTTSGPTLINCILWGNTAPTSSQVDPSATITYSDVQGGYSGTGNINADPRFVRTPSVGDDGDLHLQFDSSCINSGSNAAPGLAGVSTDITGGPRIINVTVDMGAYEYVDAPTDIALSGSSVAENQSAGTTVGTLSTTDANVDSTFTYSLVSGSGSTDNASFTVSGDALLTAASFNFEAKSTYSIRVRTTDQGGLWFEKAFTITVTDANDVPTDVSLSPGSIMESQPIGTAVGTLSTTDPDTGNTFTYSLVSGSGSTDNASFTISGSTLQSAAIFNLATKSSYSIRVRTTDQGGLWFEKTFTITVTKLNLAPTDVALSASSVAENQPSGTAVGTLSTTDPDAGDTFTYSLVSGTGSTDNTSFTILGSTLQTAASFNYEAKSSYSIRVRTTDQGGLWFEKAFTITVTNVNEAPTDITLAPSSIMESQPIGTAVGTFSTTDPDAGNTFAYSLVSGTGSTDNASFTISGSTLQSAAIFNLATKSSYSIRVRTTDQGGLWFEKVVTVTVTKLNAAPTDITLSASSIAENQIAGTAVGTLSTSDPDAGNTFTYSLVSGTGGSDNASFTISGNQLLTAAAFNFEAKNSYSIRLRTTDQGGLWFENAFTISVTNVNEAPTDTTLSPGSVAENQPIGTIVGTFSTVDPDIGSTFTYVLVDAPGGEDNNSFTISGNTLRTAAVFDFETQSTFSIRVRTTDQGGLFFGKVFTITVTFVAPNRNPTDATLSPSDIAENQAVGTAVGTLGTVDPDTGNTFTYNLVSGTGSTDNASFTISGNTLQTAASFDYETKSSYSIRLRTTDQGGLWFEKTFTISVLNAAEVVPTITGISTDTGSSSSDGITSDSTLLINGTSEPGMTISVYRGGVVAGTTSANGSGNWVFDYTGTSLGEGSYNFTATASDTLGDTTAASALYTVTIDGTAPALPTASINDGAAQRSMVKKLALSFGEKVVLGTGAVTVKKSDGSDVPDTTLLVTNPSGDQRNYVLSFSGIGVVGGSLADGIYDLSVAAAGVHDLAGNALGGNFSQRFHRLYGDYDGNKTVNNGDYFWFKQTFNKNTGDTGFLDLCDYDANGTVNNGDYFQFKKRFGVVYTY